MFFRNMRVISVKHVMTKEHYAENGIKQTSGEIMSVKKVAILTAGGLAPCLSSAIAALVESYTQTAPDVEIICYRSGYKGLLQGDSLTLDDDTKANIKNLYAFGGSPIGNSRVKLTNVKDCVKRGLVQEGQNPLHVAAEQLTRDQVDVLHTIGGDDTNTTAADLAAYLKQNDYALTVVGLPKTIDNDVFPIRQSLGAWTAAEEGAQFFANVVAEHSANPRMLIVHEVMGRNCGWLTGYTARIYHEYLNECHFLPALGLTRKARDVHAIYIPEMEIDIAAEAKRLKDVMDIHDGVNIFLSEGAGVDKIVQEMEAAGEDIPRDAFGHIKLDAVNPGQWFAKQFAEMIGAEKVLVQKSGYFSRAAASNSDDIELIQACCKHAVACALRSESGVVGEDEDHGNELQAIDFERIKGGKPFAPETEWFQDLLGSIEQPAGATIEVAH